MFEQYYALRDTSKLPPTSRFVDPIDNSEHRPEKNETLHEFTNRVVKSRAEKKFPAIPQEHITTLIEISLAETVTDPVREVFFEKKAVVPGVKHVIGLAKAIASQHAHHGTVSFLDRQDRANKCHSCPFHKSQGSFKKTITDIIIKVAGLEDIEQSELEASLGTCGMCGCSLPTKVRFDIYSVLASITPEDLQKLIGGLGTQAFERCWITQEGVNTPGKPSQLLQAKLRVAGLTDALTAYTAEKIQKARNGKK